MDATKTIMPPEPVRTLGRNHRLFTWSMLVFASGVVALSSNFLWHDLALYRLHSAAHAIRFGEPVTTSQLAQVISKVIDWDQAQDLNANDLDDAAQAVSVFANRNRGNVFLSPALLATAEKLLKERVALAPADGNSWLRLAYVRTARVGLDQLAHDALRMSWLVTPREFSVMWPSLKFRSAHWPEMSVEEQFAAADLAAGLWHKPPERDAIKDYLAKLPPHLLATLLADMTDAEAQAALSRP